MAVRIKRTDRQFLKRVEKAMKLNMTAAMAHLEGEVVKSISKGNPPSAPGEPPRVRTARLKQSITYVVEKVGNSIVGRLGTNVKYGKHLEFGTRRMAARHGS